MSFRLAVAGGVLAALAACDDGPATVDAAAQVDAGCAEGRTRCGAQCVNTDTSTSHCGGCFEGCVDGPAGDPVCVAGSCGFDCFEGWYDCDPTVPGCEEDLLSPGACGSCGHVCDDGDTCDAPDCRGVRQQVANSTFAVDLSSWVVANNPVNAVDTLSGFRLNANGDAENEPSTGACARVLYQDVFIRPDMAGAVFSAEVRSYNELPLNPDQVTVIEANPNDGISDAFRIDVIDPAADVFYAPILYTLYAPITAVGTPAEAHVVSVAGPDFVQFLRQRAGTSVRLRIAQVESNVPWHLDVDNITLTLSIVY